MEEMGLQAIQPKSFRPQTTESKHTLGYSPNLFETSPFPTAPNQIWFGDITYIPLKIGGFLYLALLLDFYSRRIVGWALEDFLKEPLVLKVLRQAIKERQPGPGLLHHTDRGGQYAGCAYRAVLSRADMIQSMSSAGNCYDNRFVESCFGTVKRELERRRYEAFETARREIGGYIRYYNVRRRHSSLGYLTPTDFENKHSRRP